MKKIIILLTTILLSIASVHSEEKVETLADLNLMDKDCYAKNKISPDTLGCSIKKKFHNLYTNDDGSLNALGKFFNAKSLADLKK